MINPNNSIKGWVTNDYVLMIRNNIINPSLNDFNLLIPPFLADQFPGIST